MRLERLTVNKIKIFLTSDDLNDRGLSKDDIWKDSIKWHQLFHDMLEEATGLLGCQVVEADLQVEAPECCLVDQLCVVGGHDQDALIALHLL